VTEIEWLPAEKIAAELDLAPGQVARLVQEQRLVGDRRGGVWHIPADFIDDGAIVKGLPGTIVLLSDAGYAPEEMIRWLFTADDSLPGTPIQALRENRGREVHRRAQAAGF
jgi:hypothetical protein